MNAGYDAIVVGAGLNGLAAAAYLARAKKRVLVLEGENQPGGMCATERFGDGFKAPKIVHTLYALDPKVVADLKLARHGLKFALRDMPLVGLRPDGKHLVIGRDAHAAARAIAAHSHADANAWPHVRRDLLRLARTLRPRWWEARNEELPLEAEALRRVSLAAWLDSHFESDALKAALAWDAGAFPTLAPGGPLFLLWHAAQEMCGSQGAVAFPLGGPAAVIDALVEAAKAHGVEIRTGAWVKDFVVNERSIAGVTLASGETIAARLVFASFSRQKLLATNAGRAALGIAEAAELDAAVSAPASSKVLLALNAPPSFAAAGVPLQGRFVTPEKLENYVTAAAEARAGRIAKEPVMEIVFPSAADPSLAPLGQYVVSVLVRLLPRHVAGGWDAAKAELAARVMAQLDRFVPGLVRHVVAVQIVTPDDIAIRYGAEDEFGDPPGVERLLSGWRVRTGTPIKGLHLCGASAEPVGAASGRAGRIAAALALRTETAR